MDEKHKQRARERFFLLIAVLTAAFFLVESPENLNSITAAVAVNSFTESNYFLGLMLFLLTAIFALYIISLIRRSKRQVWYPEPLGDEEVSIATWDAELPLDEKIQQLNRELKNLMRDQPQKIRKIAKITKIPNIKEVKLKEELNRIQNKIHGYSKPTVLQASKKKLGLDKDLSNIREQLQGLDGLKIKRVKFREEIPSKDSDPIKRVTEKRDLLKKELDSLHVKMHEYSARPREKKEEISKEVLEINKKIAELEIMPIRKVKIRTEMPKEKHFTDIPAKERLKREISEISRNLNEDKKVKKDKKFKEPEKKKNKALQEIEEKLASLED